VLGARVAGAVGSAVFLFAAVQAIRLAVLASGGAVWPKPPSSSEWIDAGLSAEQATDYGAAERALLEAARIDHQYLPAWTLANFYFRRGDVAHFWPWAARAAALAYDDLAPLVRLCDEMEPNPAKALDRLGGAPKLQRAYRDYLTGRNRFNATE
jgi:hypothetical protein